MRKLFWALLLPFFVLFAQQGELRHEYSHYAKSASSCKKAPSDTDHCPLCLAYAQLAGTAKADVAPLALLANLAFHFAPTLRVASVDGEATLPRSRGPPSL
jgi:hypothetical protein